MFTKIVTISTTLNDRVPEHIWDRIRLKKIKVGRERKYTN